MQLKEYQAKVLERLDQYLETLGEHRGRLEKINRLLVKEGDKPEIRNYCREAWDELNEKNLLPRFRDKSGAITTAEYIDRADGLKRHIPTICIKIPTGGGKTLLAAAAVERINTDYFRRQTGLVLWVVPSDAIYRQTWKNLANREHPYRQMIERASGGRVRMLEKMDDFTRQDTEEYLCVMLLMLQSSARKSKETLKMFQDSGSFTTFFPEVDDQIANKALAREIPNLALNDLADTGYTGDGVSLKHSLGNALRIVRPIVIIDEGHKAYSETARDTLNGFNPSFILELSATPNTGKKRVSNILVDVPGTALKDEEMIKLPINIFNYDRADWKHTLTQAHAQLDDLDRVAGELQANQNRYVRPIMLVRVDRTGKDQRDKTDIHAEDAREYLIDKLGVKPEAIRVKSASLDELGDEDLLADTCDVRFIITKDALREGWDCPFAYVLAILSRTTAQTALTQMIGRVLREPGAQATGLPALDECYVYCFDQEVQRAVESVRKGLEEEGMGDLGADVRDGTGATGLQAKRITVERQSRFKGLKIFLPRVLHRQSDGEYRPLDYDRDILADMDWESLRYRKRDEFEPEEQDYLQETQARMDVRAEVNGHTTFVDEQRVARTATAGELDSAFLVRLLLDVVPNPWQGARILDDALRALRAREFTESRIYANRMALIKSMKADLKEQIDARAESIFRERLESGAITFRLLSAGDDRLNWKLAETIEYEVTDADPLLKKRNGEPLERYLFEKVYQKDFNEELEKPVAWYLDGQNAVKWWHRLVARQDYYVQGWQRQRVYPDFLACVQETGNGFRFTVLETKGRQLKGNDDTEYKRQLFDVLTEYYEHVVDAGELELDLGENKMLFRMVLQDTWEADVRPALA
jgi:type III restriction enzyme